MDIQQLLQLLAQPQRAPQQGMPAPQPQAQADPHTFYLANTPQVLGTMYQDFQTDPMGFLSNFFLHPSRTGFGLSQMLEQGKLPRVGWREPMYQDIQQTSPRSPYQSPSINLDETAQLDRLLNQKESP